MLHIDVLSDPEITVACISILAYLSVNNDRVVLRKEITSRFRIGKQTYYDSLAILRSKGCLHKLNVQKK
jgi:hypothetical protein